MVTKPSRPNPNPVLARVSAAAGAGPDRSLPLRERKKLRTRQSLAEVALRLFTEQGFEATTLDELVDAVEVSKSTFFRTFPAKEAVAIEAEAQLWDVFVEALADWPLAGPVLSALRDLIAGVAQALGEEWSERYVATRRLIVTASSLLAYTAHHRLGVEQRVAELLARRLRLAPEDVRPLVLAQLTVTAWTLAARAWVLDENRGDHSVLIDRVHDAFDALPRALELSGGQQPPTTAPQAG